MALSSATLSKAFARKAREPVHHSCHISYAEAQLAAALFIYFVPDFCAPKYPPAFRSTAGSALWKFKIASRTIWT
jgi:hypothetical protein